MNKKSELQNKAIGDGSTSSHDYFHGHECHLDAEHLSAYHIKIGLWRRFLFDLTSVRNSDVRALKMFRSYASLGAERHRHYHHNPFTIHPLSKLRIYLEAIYVIIMIILGVFLAAYYSKIYTDLKVYYSGFIYFCDFMLIMNIVLNFLTGYVDGQCSKFIVLDLKLVALNYVKTWLIVDILSSISFIPHLYRNSAPEFYFILEAAKLLRLPSTVKYLHNILLVTEVSTYQKTVVEATIYIIMYLSWNIYFQFSMEYSIEGTYYPVNPRKCSWMTYGKVWNQTWSIRFFYALERSVGMLRTNTNIKAIEDLGCFETLFVVSWLISKLLIFHFALKYVILLFGTESARAKYYIMQKQVESYLIQRKFPPRLKKKILKFYAIRFHSKYFTESRMLHAMSGQLYDDILMHTGEQLIRELEFLKLLPRPLLMQVIFKLKIVTFIAGDIIFKINTIGDCLYFIDKGTVAIYTDSAQEICHVEDGDYFGEVALVMKHHFRTTSAVAVTNCELYRLDKEVFDTTIAYCTTVYENIKKEAINRFEKTCVTDEHHKADLKNAEGKDYMQ